MATATHEQPPSLSLSTRYTTYTIYSPIIAPPRSALFATSSAQTASAPIANMSQPIPISPQHSPSASSTSTLSPQTPMIPLPPGTAAGPGALNANSGGLGSSTGTGGSGAGVFRWANLGFGKSPTSQTAGAGRHMSFSGSSVQDGALDSVNHGHAHDHDHDEHHDVFEFGDIHHMSKGSWTGHGRRAASMSMASGMNAGAGGEGQNQTVSAMLSAGNAPGVGGFGGLISPTLNSPNKELSGMNIPRPAPGANGLAGSPPNLKAGGGVLADNAAKGAGVLRRLSLSGSLGRPSFLSPPSASQPLPSSQAQQPTITSALSDTKPPASSSKSEQPASGLQVPLAQRGRRYSENSAKKRGVSPMGERILRDHGGF